MTKTKISQRILFYILPVILAPVIISCASNDDITKIPARELLKMARDATEIGEFADSVRYYEQIEARFPYSVFSRQALLDQAFSYYQQGEDAQALITVERFIKLYPHQKGVDYAHYLKGMVHYGKGRGIVDFIVEASTAKRDLEASKTSYNSFNKVVTDYPDFIHYEDAKVRMNLLYNQMGQYEVNLARYYLDRQAYVASINRSSRSITDFHRAQSQEEALAIMSVAYHKLGLDEMRDNTVAILKHNYPETKFKSMVVDFWE